MYDVEAGRILRSAEYAALDEIVARGCAAGAVIERNASRDKVDSLLSIFDAVDAYYTARSAGNKNREVEK